MTKKEYIAAPDITITEIQTATLMAGSTNAVVDGEDNLNYDSTPGDASNGLARRRKDIWEDDLENVEDF